jgi:bacterial/archaeal transporter family protein
MGKKSPFSESREHSNVQTREPEPITPINPGEKHKTLILTAVVIVTNVAGNILLSRGMHNLSIVSWSPLPYLHAILNPWVASGVLILIAWMIGDLALLSLADLSYVLPVTATAYILIAILGHFVLDERISGLRWAGIVVITLGVMLVGETPSRTTPEHHHGGKPR